MNISLYSDIFKMSISLKTKSQETDINHVIKKLAFILRLNEYDISISPISEDKSFALLQHKFSKKITMLPDTNLYKLVYFNLTTYSGNFFAHEKNTREIRCIAKLVKETPKGYIIKFQEGHMINWGRGPTLSSFYAFLGKENKNIYPIENKSIFFQDIAKEYILEYDNQFSDYDFKYNSIEEEVCQICLDKKSTIYGYCEHPHLISCEDCIKKLVKCPTCYEELVYCQPVIYV